jgi:hypothetical protein
MLRTTRIAKRALLASAVAAGLGLTACGVFPVYTTEWLPVPGQVQTNQEAALAICKPIAAAERSRAELESNWPIEQGTPDDPYYDPWAVSDRSDTIEKGALTACMAERGWYPKRICVDNC